jgi:RNA polymerase sigma factor
MGITDEQAILASQDERAFEEFLTKNRGFIVKCAYEISKRYINEHDDEWSVSIMAFHEAVRTYDLQKGSFLSYASVIIKRKLIDHFRSESKYNQEISVDPSVYDMEPAEDDENTAIKAQLAEKLAISREDALKYEIQAANILFKEFGFSFFDLAETSPKSKKTKNACASAVRFILENIEILNEINQKKLLPIKKIQENTKLPRKILERHRIYVIAATQLLSNDFPWLAEYVSYITKGGK